MSHAAVLIRRCCIAMLLASVLMPVSIAELYAQPTVRWPRLGHASCSTQ